ncbi:hypothetical protein PIB30_042886 [Stylosanthes scabra]|uniref:Uncharacterized protein n=1 Tax=Stylosanthes scabra TaxID=79078 RepID=A0ABU6RFF7_9FABA|nr:hypothetical protein [Stylosanthes scabra]
MQNTGAKGVLSRGPKIEAKMQVQAMQTNTEEHSEAWSFSVRGTNCYGDGIVVKTAAQWRFLKMVVVTPVEGGDEVVVRCLEVGMRRLQGGGGTAGSVVVIGGGGSGYERWRRGVAAVALVGSVVE